MKFLKLTKPEAIDKLDFLERNSALTFEGMIPEEAHLYVDFLRDFTEVDDSVDAYIIKGAAMNEKYGLIGKNAYPKNLNFLIVPLRAFKDVAKIALPRMQIGGRWLDDIVDNNAIRNKEENDNL